MTVMFEIGCLVTIIYVVGNHKIQTVDRKARDFFVPKGVNMKRNHPFLLFFGVVADDDFFVFLIRAWVRSFSYGEGDVVAASWIAGVGTSDGKMGFSVAFDWIFPSMVIF